MASYEEVVSGLLEASHHVHPERVAPLLAEQLPQLGLDDVAVYLADLEQRFLVPVPGEGLPEREPLSINGTLAGRAFQTQTCVDGAELGGGSRAIRLWVPLTDGAERLGVIAVSAIPDGILRRRAGDAASLAAAMVVGKLSYGDGLILSRRREEMDVAAELRWDSLPPLTYVDNHVEISGVLEPVYHVAGDVFDYALNGDVAHLAILDAMGHELEASRMANLAVAAYRNARRRRDTLTDMYRFIDGTIGAAFGPEKFITGHLGMLDVGTGQLSLINAGHPPPILLRGNDTMDVAIPPSLPFGLGAAPRESTQVKLQPHDVLLFFTDGMTEARALGGELFGRERLAELFVRAVAAGPLAETARRLCHAILEYQDGHLQDDATLMLITWKGR